VTPLIFSKIIRRYNVKRFKMLLTASLILLVSFSIPIQADVREVFVCNYLDGKDMDDVLSARDFYLKQAKKAGLETPMAYV